jgi:hypothetical protein
MLTLMGGVRWNKIAGVRRRFTAKSMNGDLLALCRVAWHTTSLTMRIGVHVGRGE